MNYLTDIDALIRDGYFDACTAKVPPMDVWESKDSYGLSVELPGYKPDEITMQVKDHKLELATSDKFENPTDNGLTVLREADPKVMFERSLVLPDDADEENIKASLAKGVLTVLMAKKEVAQPREIEIA